MIVKRGPPPDMTRQAGAGGEFHKGGAGNSAPESDENPLLPTKTINRDDGVEDEDDDQYYDDDDIEPVGMQIVLHVSGLFYTLRVDPIETIGELKQRLLHRKGLPRRVKQRLEGGQTFFFSGFELHDEVQLQDYDIIKDLSTIQVIYRHRRLEPPSNPFQPAAKR